MTLINLWLVLQQICNTACSHSGSRQNFDYFSYNMSCAQYLQDQGQLDNKPEAHAFSLTLWCGFKLSFVWDYCSCSEFCAHFWQGRALLYSKPKAYNFSLVLQSGYKSSLLGSFVERGQCWILMLWSLSTLTYGIGFLRYCIYLKCPINPACM